MKTGFRKRLISMTMAAVLIATAFQGVAFAQTSEYTTDDGCMKLTNVLGTTTVTLAYTSEGVEKTYQKDTICVDAPATILWEGTLPYAIRKYSFDDRHYAMDVEQIWGWGSAESSLYLDKKTELTEPGYYSFEYRKRDDSGFEYVDVYVNDGLPASAIKPLQSNASSSTPQTSVQTVTATPTASKVLLNGKDVFIDAYNINSNNYCKIRDVAQILNGTGKQFEVVWDKDLQAVNMTSNHTYTPVGGELAKGDGSNKSATLNTAKIYLDGKAVSLTAYTINGNNYIKLRDLGQTFDFGVSWDKTLNAVVIDTSTGYTAE